MSGLIPGFQKPIRKGYRNGTHRSTSPEETVARVSPHMAAMGITRIANVTGLDRIGIPVVMVCRPNSRMLAVSQGKGITLHAAKASGLMEAVETYHAERIELPLQRASYEALQRVHRVVDVAQLPRIKRSAFRSHRPILWIEGFDLMHRETVWVPYEMVHVDYTLPPPSGSGCFQATTNGLASGNHLLEAVSHGICEVVERDATTLWCDIPREAQDRTRIDLGGIGDPCCREVLDRFDRAEVAVAVWETTSDLGIPSFLCHIEESKANPLRSVWGAFGMGCHPQRHVALLRALTEAAQCRLTRIAGSRDDNPRREYEFRLSPEVLERERRIMEVQGPMRDFLDIPNWDGDTLDADVAWELERLEGVGITRVVVVDLTKPEFGIPVVRVIIPGLEGIGLGEALEDYVPGPRARARRRGRP
jgi:YcaO-like protein with predicted kinase domain